MQVHMFGREETRQVGEGKVAETAVSHSLAALLFVRGQDKTPLRCTSVVRDDGEVRREYMSGKGWVSSRQG